MIFLKREKKSAESRKRILDAALEEFANNGYMGASLNRVCQEKNISKGMIYHYFKDKDQLYLLCLEACFDELTSYIRENKNRKDLDLESRLKDYFDTRLEFFIERPLYLGIFLDLVLNGPDHLRDQIKKIRSDFDQENISILRDILSSVSLRKDLDLDTVVDDFRFYMNYFNLAFKDLLSEGISKEEALKEHEKRCHRQLEIILYGVLERS